MTENPRTILFFTDFGADGPFLAEMELAIYVHAPEARVLNLMSNAPAASPRPSAYLLAALANRLPAESIVVAVVDPGVGTERLPILVRADGRVYVGPDNGLLSGVVRDAQDAVVEHIRWHPDNLSSSFHGRDLFAPVAGHLVSGIPIASQSIGVSNMVGADWPANEFGVVYVDHYGNAYTGIKGAEISTDAVLECAGSSIAHAAVFARGPADQPFWYVNSCGLVEIAIDHACAAAKLGLRIGTSVSLLSH